MALRQPDNAMWMYLFTAGTKRLNNDVTANRFIYTRYRDKIGVLGKRI